MGQISQKGYRITDTIDGNFQLKFLISEIAELKFFNLLFVDVVLGAVEFARAFDQVQLLGVLSS